MPSESSTPPVSIPEPAWLGLIRAQVESLKFGVVQLTIHDGRVTQIERTEKVRLPAGNVETSRRKISL